MVEARLLSCFWAAFRPSCCAFTLGLQFVARIVASTRCFVAQPKLPVWFRTFDTVAVETPASSAMSLMVVIGRIGFRVFIAIHLVEALPFKNQKLPHRCTMSMKKTGLVFVDAVPDEEVKTPYWQSSVVLSRGSCASHGQRSRCSIRIEPVCAHYAHHRRASLGSVIAFVVKYAGHSRH